MKIRNSHRSFFPGIIISFKEGRNIDAFQHTLLLFSRLMISLRHELRAEQNRFYPHLLLSIRQNVAQKFNECRTLKKILLNCMSLRSCFQTRITFTRSFLIKLQIMQALYSANNALKSQFRCHKKNIISYERTFCLYLIAFNLYLHH